MSQPERTIPAPGPDQALGRGLGNLVSFSPTSPIRRPPPDLADLHAGLAGWIEAEAEAAKDARLAELEERVEDQEHTIRGLRIALEEAEAETARLVADAERRGRHEALGVREQAGHRLPTIRA